MIGERRPGASPTGASAGGVLLVWTGLSLTCRRFRAWRSRRPLEAVA